ncbi:AraC family transcriptional regulator [Pinibacter soli]|uniref:AraC family transcriptional regulator n=1 Tax=Pinibacter soli TaxID=3044211 RepID=A0ABT6RA16_9BACT|nr:AraC family transcriptional regulator [Pinibacter soli]MDI3319385.1 AraC family transcriptional regulator [Pinibacter soli]
MARPNLPTYSICSLNDNATLSNDIIADHFSHYLEVHKDLHFPHRHSFYHLVYFTKGTGNHSIDFIRFPVEAGQIYFMNPGQIHTWDFKAEPEGFIINFLDHYVNALLADAKYLQKFSFFAGIANRQVVMIPKVARPKMHTLLQTIVDESNTSNEMKDDLIRVCLIQVFIETERYTTKAETKTNRYNSTLLRNFQQLIEEHYKEFRLTKDYAAMLYVTPNHLNALSKDLTGSSSGELIRNRVLLEAKRLLINAEINISGIANELNFEDNSYFSKFFKKYEGVTPEVFRNKYK